MLGGLRRSFAAKLVALEVGTIILVSVSLAGLLIAGRILQTHDLEQNVARGAVDSFRSDLDNAGAGLTSLSKQLADFGPTATQFQSPDRSGLTTLLALEAGTRPAGESIIAVDADGHPILGRTASAAAAGQTDATPKLSRFDNLNSVRLVQQGQSYPYGYIDRAGSSLILSGVAPVRSQGQTVGYLVDTIDINSLLRRLTSTSSGLQHSIFYDNVRSATTLGSSLLGQPIPSGLAAVGGDSQFGIYSLAGHTYAGYYGSASQSPHVTLAADVDDRVFAAQLLNDALIVLFATTLLATVLTLVAVYFARRFALRPLAELGKGAARVAGGDYTGRVEVASADELGHLGQSFNLMSERILKNTQELESQRARLDAAITSLSAVSRALTTTTAGEAALRQAVLDALAEITGIGEVAMYTGVDQPRVTATRGIRATAARQLLSGAAAKAAMTGGDGAVIRLPKAPPDYRGYAALVVPMVYQERPVGALVAFSRDQLGHIDLPSINVLANQATVALQNSLLFQRERQTVIRLQELDLLKSDFLATIQHELRTPLTAIIGITDLLDMAWQTWTEAQKLDAVGDVQMAAKGLYELVETVLDYSMIESDRLRLDLLPTAARSATDAAVEDVSAAIKRHNVKVEVKVPEDLKVQADAKRLTQVMKALLDNAVKFSPANSTVQVRGARRNGRVTLEVVDKGIGIHPDNQKRIFERFYQVDNTATRRYGGTGMGLALVEKLVTLQKGKVEVKSRPGRGSTFTVSLPAVK
ncbi:MAG TPA: ATP-binding protein [Candidatus Solibacter sp.]|jgi:signal transduction histidine kinase|nr:ATP-binding protein [Candidatus Solibacter sp.]